MTDEEKKVYDAMKKSKEPVKAGDLAKTIGLDSKVVAKAIGKLKKEGKVISPKNCYYCVA